MTPHTNDSKAGSWKEELAQVIQKLVNNITIAGYGKADEPNDLIETDDVQPFAGYQFYQDKALQAIVKANKKWLIDAPDNPNIWRQERDFDTRDELRDEQRKAMM